MKTHDWLFFNQGQYIELRYGTAKARLCAAAFTHQSPFIRCCFSEVHVDISYLQLGGLIFLYLHEGIVKPVKMWVCIFTLCGVLAVTIGQRVAPGVPPQQYNPNQQVPAHQHVPQHQQVPINQQVPQYQAQHGHVPQMQQVPLQQQQQQHMQQQQQHIPQMQHQQQQQQMGQQHGQHGQIPVEHGAQHGAQHGGHHGGHNPQQLLNVANMMNEKEHIQEHMEVPMDTSKMSEQELQFHYFKMHDADNNNKLDGCELIKSLIHWHDPPDGSANNEETKQQFQTDEQFASQVDPILKQHDLNNDGYIDYVEFRNAESAGVK